VRRDFLLPFVVERLLKLKACLQSAAVSVAFKDWIAKEVLKKPTLCQLTRVLLDESFWCSCERMVNLLLPCLLLLRDVDSHIPMMGKIYYKMFQVHQGLQEFGKKNADCPDAANLFWARWDYCYCDCHGAGYCLDPEFVGHEQMDNAEV